MSDIIVRDYERLIERIRNGTASRGDIERANILTEVLGRKHSPLFTPSGKYLGLGAIKIPKLRIDIL